MFAVLGVRLGDTSQYQPLTATMTRGVNNTQRRQKVHLFVYHILQGKWPSTDVPCCRHYLPDSATSSQYHTNHDGDRWEHLCSLKGMFLFTYPHILQGEWPPTLHRYHCAESATSSLEQPHQLFNHLTESQPAFCDLSDNTGVVSHGW